MDLPTTSFEPLIFNNNNDPAYTAKERPEQVLACDRTQFFVCLRRPLYAGEAVLPQTPAACWFFFCAGLACMQLACAKKAVGNFAIGLKQPRTSIQMLRKYASGTDGTLRG